MLLLACWVVFVCGFFYLALWMATWPVEPVRYFRRWRWRRDQLRRWRD